MRSETSLALDDSGQVRGTDLPLVGRDRAVRAVESSLLGGDSVVVLGETGVGKTRLAHECAILGRSRGWEVEFFAGSEAGRDLSFAALARLLPAVDAHDPHHLIQVALAGIRRREAVNGLLLVIDDAQLLDHGSAALLQHVVLDGAARCVFTVRHSSPCPDSLTQLWRDGYAASVTLEALDRANTRELVAAVLGGPPGPVLEQQVWRLSQGSPLFVHEILESTRRRGFLVREDSGIWRLDRSPEVPPRLVDVIEQRLANLDDRLREALELVAVGEPLRLPVALEVLSVEVLAELERTGLTIVDDASNLVRLRHPLYGEALRSGMSTTRRVELAGPLADTLTRSELATPGDSMLAAKLFLDAGRTPPRELAVDGAREAIAMFEPGLAERLLRHAPGPPEYVDHLLLGRALRLQERGKEADAALRSAVRSAHGDEEFAEAALAHARNRGWVLGDLARAQQILTRARDRITDEAWKAVLEAEISMQLAAVGDIGAAREVTADALDRPAISERTELTALLISTIARALMLDTDGFGDEIQRGLELAEQLRAEEPHAADQLLLAKAQVLVYRHPPSILQLAAERTGPTHPVPGLWHLAAGMGQLVMGDLSAATAALRDATALLKIADPFANLDQARSVYGLALAQTGELEELQRVRVRLLAAEPRRQPRMRVWADRALAWERAMKGDLDAAVATLLDAAAFAIAHNHTCWGVDALHDLVRLGAPDQARRRLDQATAHTPLPLPQLFADHATALSEQDPAALQYVAEDFADVHALLFAAEAHTQASACYHRDGADAAAARAATRAQMFAGLCPGADTPALRGIDEHGLSSRELEVARWATRGLTSQAIAAQLVVSHRTVESHLGRAYRKLGITSRGELIPILRPPAIDPRTPRGSVSPTTDDEHR